ncbi:MAG: M43 family zinc metalloprotease [Flavobacteriales bacterium]
MQKFTVVFSVLLVFCFGLNHAQQYVRCASQEYILHRELQQPGYAKRINQTLEQISSASVRKDGNETVYRIPVVIHILYNNEDANLHDSIIQNQINILNQDFRRQNPDTTETREVFKPVAADSRIEFYLAGIDPEGNPTNGITRTQTSTSFALSVVTNNIKQTSAGGKDAWPTNRYLNIWVGDLSIFGTPLILGYATPPDGAPNWPAGSAASQPQFDGVVIHNQVFGSDNPLLPPSLSAVSKGRTTTHEVGHYLGLRHIWGDGGGVGGGNGCDADDGIDDTPNAAAASQQTCNYANNTCVDTPIDLPDMIENYMDYSDESCMNMFSRGQINAMRFCIENFRQELVDTTNAPIGLNEISHVGTFNLFPNPASDKLSITSADVDGEADLFIYDIKGNLCTRSIIELRRFQSTLIDVSFLQSGVYYIILNNKHMRRALKFVKSD